MLISKLKHSNATCRLKSLGFSTIMQVEKSLITTRNTIEMRLLLVLKEETTNKKTRIMRVSSKELLVKSKWNATNQSEQQRKLRKKKLNGGKKKNSKSKICMDTNGKRSRLKFSLKFWISLCI